MTFHTQLRELWLQVSEVSLSIASLRDEYARGPLLNTRFTQLDNVYANLNDIEQGLFELLEIRKPLVGQKPEREFLMIARPALANAKGLLSIATDELESNRADLKQRTDSGPATAMSTTRFTEIADLANQLSEMDAAMSLTMKLQDHQNR